MQGIACMIRERMQHCTQKHMKNNTNTPEKGVNKEWGCPAAVEPLYSRHQAHSDALDRPGRQSTDAVSACVSVPCPQWKSCDSSG